MNAAGRNRRSVWTIATQPYSGAHFATFPPKLIEPCILAGCPIGGTVLDPFNGSGVTLLESRKHSRKGLGIELNEEYCAMSARRLARGAGETITAGARAVKDIPKGFGLA